MSTKDLLRKSLSVALPVFGALYLLACGGSTTILGDGSGGSGVAGLGSGGSGSSGSAGSAPAGGDGSVCNVACPAIACGPGFVSVPGECCAVCAPGSGGSAGVGGGAAGYGGCGVTACPAIACESGFSLQTEPGECCPSCVSASDGGVGGGLNCSAVDCAPAACAPGYFAITEPGQCCSTCLADSQACSAGEQGYMTLRASLLQQAGATSCNVDSDCTTLPGFTECGDECSITVVNASLEPDMLNQLSLWASNYCSTCIPTAVPCFPPATTPFCSAGQCQLYHAL